MCPKPNPLGCRICAPQEVVGTSLGRKNLISLFVRSLFVRISSLFRVVSIRDDQPVALSDHLASLSDHLASLSDHLASLSGHRTELFDERVALTDRLTQLSGRLSRLLGRLSQLSSSLGQPWNSLPAVRECFFRLRSRHEIPRDGAPVLLDHIDLLSWSE